MAEGLERVRISASELRGILATLAPQAGSRENMKELKEPRQRKDNRRPDLEIYKPGLSRLRNRPKTKEAPGSEEFKDEIVNDRESSVGNDSQLIKVCKELDNQQQNGPTDPENRQAQETYSKTVGVEDPSLRIIKRIKKPDLQIYQPGRRLQTVTKDSASRADEEEILNQVEQLRIEEDECKGKVIKEEVVNKPDKTEAEKNQTNDRVRTAKGEKGKKVEKGEGTKKVNDDSVQGKPGSVKRYSRSDKRRNRYRTCSTSSAGSNNSAEGAGLTDNGCRRRRQDRTKERPRLKKQVSMSSTDSLDEDRVEEPDGLGSRRGSERKKHLERNWSGRGEGEQKSNGKENRGTLRVTFEEETMSKDSPMVRSARENVERIKPDKGLSSGGKGSEKQEFKNPKQELRGRGRGILILPAHTALSVSSGGSPESAPLGPRLLFGSGSKGSRNWGRGGTTRRLWDPNNPDQKPALKSQTPQLHFLDTDDEISPTSWGDSRQAQASYYKFQNSDNPYYYPRTPGPTSQYPYTGYSPMQYPVGPTNGMYPGPYYPGYPAPSGQYVCSPLPASTMSPEEIEQHMRNMQQQELHRLLRVADNQELQLSNLLSRDRISTEGMEKMAQLRTELLQLYERCILLDIEFSDNQNVDQILWKNAFYQVIEKFRQLLKDPNIENPEQIRNRLLELLDEGSDFFDSLLQKLQVTYKFKLEDYMDGLAIRSKPLRKTVKYALISAQRCMICQGDISRYREQANDTTNYGKARSWYLKAQHIAPKNGRPYNQLALLAVYTRRKLDAVYYYMRSLAASNPILTAKESLMSLFEETKRKAEQMEKKQHEEFELTPDQWRKGKKSTFRHVGDDTTRLEIWIHPSHSRSSQGTESGKDSEQENGLGSLSPSDQQMTCGLCRCECKEPVSWTFHRPPVSLFLVAVLKPMALLPVLFLPWLSIPQDLLLASASRVLVLKACQDRIVRGSGTRLIFLRHKVFVECINEGGRDSRKVVPGSSKRAPKRHFCVLLMLLALKKHLGVRIEAGGGWISKPCFLSTDCLARLLSLCNLIMPFARKEDKNERKKLQVLCVWVFCLHVCLRTTCLQRTISPAPSFIFLIIGHSTGLRRNLKVMDGGHL
ncbi:Smg6 [Phodopus roborovskii]|uniref:Nonsense-mediated mRNA decay factor n=1 Tax=Phodopus roborovskii TaxID=109678 RepID=A0AAU9Z152_PHORO|nr:Smg6 [Phodopus roborovskii]